MTAPSSAGDEADLQAVRTECTELLQALEQLEREVHEAWPMLDADRPLLFATTPADLRRAGDIGARALATFERRARWARLETVASRSLVASSVEARRLSRRLRRQAQVEGRMESLDTQLAAFEHVYEMASQRLGEFRAAHDGARIEWLIVALLAFEVVLMLLELQG